MKKLLISALVLAAVAFVDMAVASMPGPNQLLFIGVEAGALLLMVGLVMLGRITK